MQNNKLGAVVQKETLFACLNPMSTQGVCQPRFTFSRMIMLNEEKSGVKKKLGYKVRWLSSVTVASAYRTERL